MPEQRPSYDDKLAGILRTAASIFAEQGYDRASIRAISRATGVSLSGLYYYVDSKEELLFRIQDHCFGTVLRDLERRLEGVEDPERRLRLFIRNHLHFFVNNMDEMKVLSHEADSLTGEYRERVNAKKKRYTDICAGTLEELRPAERGPDVRVATFSLFGMINWIYNWYDPERDAGVEELADEMSRLFLRGCLAPGAASALPGGGQSASEDTEPSIWR